MSRWHILFLVVAATGCVTQRPDLPVSARRHASNVAAAEKAGYRIVEKNGQTLFCATEVTTGSHILPSCLTEAGWEREQLWVWQGGSAWAEPMPSRRSPYEGTLGY